jgi:hypothetical protein
MIDALSGYSTATGFLLQTDNQDLLKAFDRGITGRDNHDGAVARSNFG